MSAVEGLIAALEAGDKPEGYSIEIERQMVDVTSMDPTRPDPDWEVKDLKGHVHRYGDGFSLPTLEWVVTLTWWCEDCNDEHDEGEWRCVQCGEPIKPGRRPVSGRQMVPGRIDVKVNGEYPESQEQSDRLYAVLTSAGLVNLQG
jgi:hypothetical protein